MTTTAPHPAARPADERRRLRLTPEEYHFLCEQGMVPKRSEFVDGEIYELAPHHWDEGKIVRAFADALVAGWHDRWLVGANATHVFPSGWEPLPDVTVHNTLPPPRPGSGVVFPMPRLVVEVADTTLDYDLGEKALRYAAESIEELWVADVAGRQIYAHRQATGGRWRQRLLFVVGDEVSPLCLPDARLKVADLLPDLYGQQPAAN